MSLIHQRIGDALPVDQEHCVVCGKLSEARVCRACTVFFRRSVSYKREYVCLNDPVRCSINGVYGSPPRHMCKLCRFTRCIRFGMLRSHSAILDQSIDEFHSFSSDSLLRKIMIAQRATFINRYAAQLRAFGGNHALVKMGKENIIFANRVVIASEFMVLGEYLKSAGFSEFGLSKLELLHLAKELFHTWLTFRGTITTLRNTSAHQTDVCYFVDGSFVKIEEETLYRYVKTLPGLLDYHFAARSAIDCCKDKVRYAKKLRDAKTEELEHAVLFHLFTLKTAQRVLGNHSLFRPEIDRIFNELRSHFGNECAEFALTIGNLTLMLGELGSWSKSLSEFVTVLTLNGYNSLLSDADDPPLDPKCCVVE